MKPDATNCENMPAQSGSTDGEDMNCNWSEDVDGLWQTSCGKQFEFNDSTPLENGAKFCLYCGKPLTQTLHVEEVVAPGC